MQGCIKTATQSRCTMQRHKWLSMHRCNGTNGCRRKDAPTQTTANARMRDSACPKFRTMRNQQSKHDVQGCKMAVAQSRRKDAPTQTTAIRHPATLSPAQQAGYYFLVRREGEPATCGSCKDAYKQQLIQFFIQRVDKLQQYIAKSV